MNKLLVVILLTMIVSKIFASQLEVEFRYPVDIEFTTSKKLVEHGDIIDICIEAQVDLDHEHFEEKFNYVLINPANKFAYTLMKWNTPPEEMVRNMSSHKEKFKNRRNWIILSSGDDVVADSQKGTISYTFSIKIIKTTNSKHIRLPITFFKFDQIKDYGGYKNYINSENKTTVQHDYDTFYLELEIKEPILLKSRKSISDKATPIDVNRETPIYFEQIESPEIN
jgi:hypothetical protein